MNSMEKYKLDKSITNKHKPIFVVFLFTDNTQCFLFYYIFNILCLCVYVCVYVSCFSIMTPKTHKFSQPQTKSKKALNDFLFCIHNPTSNNLDRKVKQATHTLSLDKLCASFSVCSASSRFSTIYGKDIQTDTLTEKIDFQTDSLYVVISLVRSFVCMFLFLHKPTHFSLVLWWV